MNNTPFWIFPMLLSWNFFTMVKKSKPVRDIRLLPLFIKLAIPFIAIVLMVNLVLLNVALVSVALARCLSMVVSVASV